MANFRIGAIINGDGQSQSFEEVGSWDTTSTVSFSIQTTHVHSSDKGAHFQSSLPSLGNAFIKYKYDPAEIELKKSSVVTTHAIASTAFISTSDGGFGFTPEAYLYNTSQNCTGVPIVSIDVPHQTQIGHISNSNSVQVVLGIEDIVTRQLNADNVFTMIDPFDLHPSWELEESEEANRVEYTTLNKKNTLYDWGFNKTWNVPVSYLANSEAALLNDWWRNQWNLLWMVNSEPFIVRITNGTTPVTQLQKPYMDRFKATLSFQTLHYSLMNL